MPQQKIDPMRLTPKQAAQLLSKAGGEKVTEADIANIIAAGAPVDSSGNINLVHLGAWLLKDAAEIN